MTLLALLALPASAWTWAPPPEAPVLGTPLELRAKVSADAGPLVPVEGQPTGAFEVLAAEAGADGTARVTVMVFGLGRQALPALRWTGAGGKVVESPPLELTLSPPPPRPSDTGDIREARGPYAARMGTWWGLLAAALAAAAWALWRLTRKAPAAAASGAAPPDPRSPEERALDALSDLDGQGLPVKEFYDRVSDILRAYLAERHGLDALRMTTAGLQRAMIRAGLLPEGRQLVKALLERCDLAKFARMRPSDQEGRRDLEEARRAVKLLAPADTGVDGDLAGLPAGGRR